MTPRPPAPVGGTTDDGPDDAMFLHILAAKIEQNGRALIAMGALNGKVTVKTAERLRAIAGRLESLSPLTSAQKARD
jgi:hypothetical protein